MFCQNEITEFLVLPRSFETKKNFLFFPFFLFVSHHLSFSLVVSLILSPPNSPSFFLFSFSLCLCFVLACAFFPSAGQQTTVSNCDMRAASFFPSKTKRRVKKANHASLSSFAFTSLALAAAASASRLSVSTRKSSMVRNLDSSRDLSCKMICFLL